MKKQKRESRFLSVYRTDKRMLSVMLISFLLYLIGADAVASNDMVPEGYGLPGITKQTQTSRRTIKGSVVDERNEPIIGASVIVSGTTNGTVTDLDGLFQLQVSGTNLQLEISYIGYEKMTVSLNNNQTTVSVILNEDSQLLEDIVIVGYGVQKKETVTGAISSVTTKDLVQSPQANVSNMLAGRMPGLFAVQRSGEPGYDESTIRIRGVGTFAAGDGSQDPLIMVDGIETTTYNNIDPNEIESLTILKDASATAVYGVRGANGVILITTKRGEQGKPKITYTGNIAINKLTDIRETMGAYQYATSYNQGRMYDAYISGGYTPRFTDEEIEMFRTGEDPIFYPDVNWYDVMLRSVSPTTQHNINVSGGVDKAKYFISAGYYNQQGLFNSTSLLDGYDVQSAYERFNFRANLDFEVTKQLSVRINLSSQMETRTGNAGSDSGSTTLMDMIARANPVSTPGIVDGKIVYLGTTGGNPLQNLYENGFRKDYRNYLNGSVTIKYSFDPWVKGLSLHGTYSYQNYYRHQQKYTKNLELYNIRRLEDDTIIFQPQKKPEPFRFVESWGKNRRSYVEAGLNYERTFSDDHAVTALILYNQSTRIDPYLEYKIPNSYQSLVGRVTYAYKNKYLAEFNAGYNGTENFAEGNRFGFFPAYSLGWIISEEKFFPQNPVVSFLKLRGSYGEVGNDRIGGDRFLYLPTTYVFNNTNDGYYLGEVGSTYQRYDTSSEGKIGNPILTWERAKKTDIGGEISFWNHRIRISGDYFIEKRDNILSNPNTTPVIFGGSLPAYNLGRMKNSGWDGEITFNHAVRNFNYWVRANYTYAHNEIQYQDEVNRQYAYQNRTGQILGQYFGLICDGIYNTWEEVNNPNRPKSAWNNDRIQPGDLIYRDVNGDGVIDEYDQVPIGYANFPEIIYGFSFGGAWKGIDFSALFQGTGNVSLAYSRMFYTGFMEDFSAPKYLERSWSQERYEQGLPIDFPRLSEGSSINAHNYQRSTFWVRDASYLRLKNIEIGYTFPSKTLKKAGITNLRLFFNASNLYTWHKLDQGIDPEFGEAATNKETYPVTKTFNWGVNISF